MNDEHKSAELVRIAEENGWKTQVVPEFPSGFDESPRASDILWHFYGLRGTETIHVIYRGERMLENNVYTFGTYRRYPQRRVAILALLTGQPDLSKNKNTSAEVLLENRTIRWSEDTPAMEIMLDVLGKNIGWIRKIDGALCEARVPKESNLGSKYFRIYDHRNGRYLEFLNYEGFHTVPVDTIVSIG